MKLIHITRGSQKKMCKMTNIKLKKISKQNFLSVLVDIVSKRYLIKDNKLRIIDFDFHNRVCSKLFFSIIKWLRQSIQ